MGPELLFLGTSAAIQVPAFFCPCQVCEAARSDAAQRRTRACAALLGQEVTLIDASPDIEAQLERERIQRMDNISVTHWHWDHIAGLAAFAEPSGIKHWPPIDLYLPREVAHHIDQDLGYMQKRFNVIPTQPGDRFELLDGTWEVVKTTHTPHSVGFAVEATRRFAYLVDGVIPPPETLARLQDLDLVILEATVDELDVEGWFNFSLEAAVDCWRQIGAQRCILTHYSSHSWRQGDLVAGLSHHERLAYEAQTPGLEFAREGTRVTV
jgi:phosphoribosyl 1,2-cyclic phosphate phosphodiesterase